MNMLSVFIVGGQLVLVILFGIFVRIDTATLDNASSFVGTLVFLLGFSLLGAAQKHLSWTSLGNLLYLFSICLQWNLLWQVLWRSCFTSFSSSFTLTIADLVQCCQCTLFIILFATDLIGKMFYTQLLYICLISVVGFSLNSAIINYGLDVYDGGCGLQVFVFSAAVCLTAWIFGIRLKDLSITKQNRGYHTQTFGLIGLLLVIYGWPFFNMGGSLITQPNTLLTATVVQSSAFINTLLALTGAILCSMLLYTPHTKAEITTFIDAIINGGIIVSSFTDIIIYPVAAILLSGVAALTTIILFKYLSNTYLLTYFPQSSLRLLYGCLSGVFAAIAVAARIDYTPTLANDLSTKAGLELAALGVSLGTGCIFGIFSGLILIFVPGPATVDIQTDTTFWEISQEVKPLNYASEKNKNVAEITSRLDSGLMAKHRLDTPDGAGTIKRNDSPRPESNRVYATRLEDQPSSAFRGRDGSIVRQMRQSFIKQDDLAARPTNMSTLQINIVPVEENSLTRPVGRQLDFDSIGSEAVGQQTIAGKAN